MEILRQQVHIPEEESLAQKVFPLLDSLAEMVPLWRMGCNTELDAADVSFTAMSRDLE